MGGDASRALGLGCGERGVGRWWWLSRSPRSPRSPFPQAGASSAPRGPRRARAAGKVRVRGAWGSAGSAPRRLLELVIRVGGRDRDLGAAEDPGHPLTDGRSGWGQMRRERAVPAAPLALLPQPGPHPCTVARGGVPRSFSAFPAFQSASV